MIYGLCVRVYVCVCMCMCVCVCVCVLEKRLSHGLCTYVYTCNACNGLVVVWVFLHV